MKSKRLTTLLSLLFAMVMAFGCYFALNVNTAKAEEQTVYSVNEVSLTMADGALLRVNEEDGKTGLRFMATMSKEEYQGLMANENYKGITFGVVIAPEVYHKNNALNQVNLFDAENAVYDWAEYDLATQEWVYNGTKTRVINIWAEELSEYDGDYAIKGSITNIKESNLLLDFVGVAYIKAELQDGSFEYKFPEEIKAGENAVYVSQKYIDVLEKSGASLDQINAVKDMYLNKLDAGQKTVTYDFDILFKNPVNGGADITVGESQRSANIGDTISSVLFENGAYTVEAFDEIKVYAGQPIEKFTVKYIANVLDTTLTAKPVNTGSDNAEDRTLSGIEEEIMYAVNQSGEVIYEYTNSEMVLAKDSLAVGETWFYALTQDGWVKVEIINATHFIANDSDLNTYVNGETENTYAVLTQKITMPTSTWSVNGTFKGVLDGQENTIDGLKTGVNLGLFKTLAGTIKNVVFTNVVVNAGGATLAKNISGIVNIENVYINVKSFVGDKGYHQSAVISNARGSHMLNYDGVVVVASSIVDDTAGLAMGYGHQVTVSIKNSTFVGANGKLYGDREESGYILKPAISNSVEGKDFFVGDDVTDIYVARKAGNLVMADFINAEFNKIHNVTEVSTLAEIKQLSGTENVVLTDNISQSSYYNSESSSFSGIFNGNGHSISIMPTRDKGRALFTTFNGTMKNVAFTNINLGAKTALVGYNTTGATVKDVYVEIAGVVLGYVGKLYQTGGLFGQVSGGRLNLKNVIVKSTTNAWDADAGKNVAFTGANDESNEYGFVGGWINGTTVNMENCQFIGGNGRIYGYKADGSAEYKPSNELTGYNIYTNVSGLKTAVANQTVVLDGMIKTFYDNYIA